MPSATMELWDWMFNTALPALLIIVVGVAILAAVAWAIMQAHDEARDKSSVKGRKPCCPPGLGCNDPIGPKSCYRQQAQRVAGPDERIALDAAWAEFHGAGTMRQDAKLKTYERIRDGIYAEAFARTVEAMGQPDNSRLLVESTVLESNGGKKKKEKASGEVLDEDFSRPPGW